MANDNKIIVLRHLTQSAMRCAAMVTSKISELTTAITEDLTELDNAKQDKITGTAGQVVGFDESGNAIAQDAPTSVPTVTTENNGQFLRVVNGAWAATTVQSAEEVSF